MKNSRFLRSHRSWMAVLAALSGFVAAPAIAQDTLPWQRQAQSQVANEDVYRERLPEPYQEPRRDSYDSGRDRAPPTDRYGDYDNRGSNRGGGYNSDRSGDRYGDAYEPPRNRNNYERYERYDDPPPRAPYAENRAPSTYSQNEILNAGHGFFGSISKGMASAGEYVFKQQGQPNGYILGEDAGGAFVAGLRYGEGVLYTRDAGTHRVYWQGPSIGYDFGGEGSKVMVLVYNLRHPGEIYKRFGGVQGSAYLVGGVGVQLQKRDDVVLAPIRAGVGVRFGANVGYLKYTRSPTWNPF